MKGVGRTKYWPIRGIMPLMPRAVTPNKDSLRPSGTQPLVCQVQIYDHQLIFRSNVRIKVLPISRFQVRHTFKVHVNVLFGARCHCFRSRSWVQVKASAGADSRCRIRSMSEIQVKVWPGSVWFPVRMTMQNFPPCNS